MRSPRRSSTLAVLIFFGFSAALAQSPGAAAGKYAGEPFVIQRLDLVYDMKADGTGSMQRTFAATVQTDAALREFGVIHVPFASATEHVEFGYVRVRRPDGSVTETPGSGVIEQPTAVTREAPFYSDQKEAQLPVKNLQVGDTLEWQVRVVRTKAEALNQFWGAETFLSGYGVVLEQSIELRVPAAGKTIVWTNPELKLKPTETTSGERKIYRWETSALMPTTGPEADAEKKAKKTRLLTPAEEADAELGKLPSVAWSTFQSWAEVGAWYRGLMATRALPDEEIKAEANELTAGKTTDEEKAKALYAYVSAKIRYIGVAFGIGRYQPHIAADVLHNQYGDCKDKALLLTSLLTAVGVPSDAVLVGAGIRFNEAVPSPGAFNHLITRLRVSGQEVWLDSTEEIAPYKMMYYGLRDHEALVVPSAGDAAIEKTPKHPPFASVQTWKSSGVLNSEGISESHVEITLRGDEELVLRAVVRQLSTSQYDEAMQRFANGLGYSGTTSHAHFSPPEDTTGPFIMEFDYHREKAGDWPNLRTIPQLAPVGLPAVDEASPPVASINLGVPSTNISQAEMKLPEGWRAELPEAVHEKAPFAAYDMTYRLEKGTIYTERQYTVLQQKVPAKDWEIYKKFTDAISLGNETYIQLRRGNGSSFAEPAGPKEKPDGSNMNASAKPAALIRDAIAAAQSTDIVRARRLLDTAKSIQPKERYLWSTYGYVAMTYGMPNEAMEDFRKELAFHPEAVETYEAIAQIQMQQRKSAEAEQTLREWMKQDGSNPQPHAILAAVLFDRKDAKGAAEQAQKALKLQPSDALPNERLELLLGRAQLLANQRPEGEATLTGLLRATEDPGIQNDAAYDLADANLALPLDEEKTRLALDKLSAETITWTLDEAPATLQAKSNLLVAAWDTMGWIYFREKRFEEARDYIAAAYRNRPNAAGRTHLEQVYAAMALMPQSKTSPRADATVTASIPPDGQESRTIDLGPSALEGVAEYRLLMAPGRVERAEPNGDKRVGGGGTMLQAAPLKGFFPQGATAKLARNAMLNCFGGKCQLVFIE